jgi:hypothetical protein
MPSDGRYASFPDRTAHSSLTHVGLPTYKEDFGDRPFEERIILEGMLNKKPLELLPLAKSWMQPPELTEATGCASHGYDRAQRAYVLTADAPRMSFALAASDDNPIYNPCVVIKNWGSKDRAVLKIDGAEQTFGPDCRQGLIRDTDGSYTKIVWVKREATSPVKFEISKG